MEYQDVMKHRWAAIIFLCVCSQFTGYCYLGPRRLKFEPNLGTALFSAVIGYLTARSVLDPGCPNSLNKAVCFFLQSLLSLVFNNFALALLWIPMVKAGVRFCGLLSEIKLLPNTPYWMRTVFCLMALGSTGIAMYNTIFQDIIHFFMRYYSWLIPIYYLHTLARLVFLAHINHIRKVAGVESVGLGAGYDGINFTPQGLEDVSSYPALFAHLIGTGLWDVEDLKKLAGLNFLRVMEEAERVRDAMLNEGIPPYEDDAPRQQINNCTSPHLF